MLVTILLRAQNTVQNTVCFESIKEFMRIVPVLAPVI